MVEIRHTGAAQRAFRTMLDHYIRTRTWDARLLAEWHRAEAAEDEIEEWRLDALHEATMADLDDLAAGYEAPLAIADPSVRWHEYLDR